MTPSMMAMRNTLPLNNHSTLVYIREKIAIADAETIASAAGVSDSKPQRDSMTARLSRKMKESFWSKRVRKQDAVEKDSRKSAFYRQFIEARAFMNTGIRR